MWLVLVDNKEPTGKLRRTGFKVIGKTEGVSQEMQGRENLQKKWSAALDATEPSNKV